MKTCPLGHTCDKCLWHTEIQMTHSVTRDISVEKRCAIAWIPELLVHTARESYSVGAAVESTRNALVGSLGETAGAFLKMAQGRLEYDNEN